MKDPREHVGTEESPLSLDPMKPFLLSVITQGPPAEGSSKSHVWAGFLESGKPPSRESWGARRTGGPCDSELQKQTSLVTAGDLLLDVKVRPTHLGASIADGVAALEKLGPAPETGGTGDDAGS